MDRYSSKVAQLNVVLEGFDKPGILPVFNAETKMKPEYPPAGGFEDFIFVTRQKTSKRTVLQSLLIVDIGKA